MMIGEAMKRQRQIGGVGVKRGQCEMIWRGLDIAGSGIRET